MRSWMEKRKEMNNSDPPAQIYFVFSGIKLTFLTDVPNQNALLWKSERHQLWALKGKKEISQNIKLNFNPLPGI